MKFLLITTPAKDLFSINSYSDVVNYYIQKYFNTYNIDYDIFPMKTKKTDTDADLISIFNNLDVSSYDFVLALGLRYFTTIPSECGIALKKKNTLVVQLHDGSLLDFEAADLTLTTRDDSSKYPLDAPANRHYRHHTFNKYIGWAADKELFIPLQFSYELRILVDHTIYDISQPDRTMDILIKIREFINSGAWKNKYINVRVRMIIDNEIIDVDVNDFSIKPYSRKGVPYIEMAKEMCRTDIYFVTHGETVGLNALEAAMAGALVAVPVGYIPESLISTIHHFEFDRTINWTELLTSLDTKLSRAKAIEHDWGNVTKKILDTIVNHQKIV